MNKNVGYLLAAVMLVALFSAYSMGKSSGKAETIQAFGATATEVARKVEATQIAVDTAKTISDCYDAIKTKLGQTKAIDTTCASKYVEWDSTTKGIPQEVYGYYAWSYRYPIKANQEKMYIVLIRPGSHLVLKAIGPTKAFAITDDEDGFKRFVVLGDNFEVTYETGFEPEAVPIEEPSEYVTIQVSNPDYNSAGCGIYRTFGGTGGNMMSPNYSPQCEQPTHSERVEIEP